MERAKREMEIVAQIGGKRFACATCRSDRPA